MKKMTIDPLGKALTPIPLFLLRRALRVTIKRKVRKAVDTYPKYLHIRGAITLRLSRQ